MFQYDIGEQLLCFEKELQSKLPKVWVVMLIMLKMKMRKSFDFDSSRKSHSWMKLSTVCWDDFKQTYKSQTRSI